MATNTRSAPQRWSIPRPGTWAAVGVLVALALLLIAVVFPLGYLHNGQNGVEVTSVAVLAPDTLSAAEAEAALEQMFGDYLDVLGGRVLVIRAYGDDQEAATEQLDVAQARTMNALKFLTGTEQPLRTIKMAP